MLKIVIPATEKYDEINNEFIYYDECTIQLEHSLVSISKWESKWNKPFLSKDEKTKEQMIDYIRCMTISTNVNPNVYNNITNKNMKDVDSYIKAPMTATWFGEDKNAPKSNREIITSELIYYWMITLNIPFECQKWHLNRLLTLIRVINVKNSNPKKMSKSELASRNRALNKARQASHKTRG